MSGVNVIKNNNMTINKIKMPFRQSGGRLFCDTTAENND